MSETNGLENQKSTWKRFIDAKKKLIAAYEKPIYTKGVTEGAFKGSTLCLELDQEYSRKQFYHLLKQTFRLESDKIDTENGYFHLDWRTNVSKDNLLEFKKVADLLYFDYEPNPVLEGSFQAKSDAFEKVEAFLKRKRVSANKRHTEKALNLTVDELSRLKVLIKENQLEDNITLNERFGVVIKFRFNLGKLITDAIAQEGFDKYLTVLKVGFDSESSGQFVSVRNLRLREEELLQFFEKNNYTLKRLRGTILAKKADGSVDEFELNFADAFCTYLYRRFDLHERQGYVDSKVYDLIYTFQSRDSMESLRNKFLDIYQPELLDLLKPLTALEFFPYNETMYFECGSMEELAEAVEKLYQIPHLSINYNPTDFKVKVRYTVTSPLAELQKKLQQQFPNIQVWLSDDGSNLYFRYFFDFETRVAASLAFRNYIENLEEAGIYNFKFDGAQQVLRFLAIENEEAKRFQETEKLAKLKSEEFVVGQGRGTEAVGTLEKFDFPYLYIKCEKPQSLALGSCKEISANLKGEKEKIQRLVRALYKITESPKELPNKNVAKFIFDSSKAKGIDDEEVLHEDSPLWEEVQWHSYLKLNNSQVRAVASTLAAYDLALVQGPPGTGKSTAISQIIWHHIRREQTQKLLLTSETNMAVDNALEKLENRVHNLVKPIRIGKEENIEAEGSCYSLTSIRRWEQSDESKSDGNAVTKWMENILRRSQAKATLPDELQQRWNTILSAPERPTKTLFATQYLNHVNVIASTGSFIGDYNSENRLTSFYKQYLQVYDLLKYHQRFVLRQHVQGFKKIAFDVVVMDEASKATPPEVALPLTYAKKAIVIGDHRQLPPMLDEDDFKSTLESIGEMELAKAFSREDVEVSHFERLFMNPNIPCTIKSTFDTQYRMHPHINEVIKQFYVDDGGLLCGIPEEKADDPDLAHPLSRFHGLSHEGFLEPHEHLLWVDVDEPEMKEGTSRVNFFEVDAVQACLEYLRHSDGFMEFQNHWTKEEEKEIGLISFYGRQLRYLSEMAEAFTEHFPVRVRTVDKFQGMERNIVIVSMVRSNKIMQSRYQPPDLQRYPESKGYQVQDSLGFAEFPNRLNVALSRAKRLLIIVGNSSHFTSDKCYKRVYETVKQLGRVIDYRTLTKYKD